MYEVTNPFEMFDIAIGYTIDKNELKSKFLALQKEYHPDNISSQDVILSSNINSSYEILSDDFKRAVLVLELQSGIKLDMTYQTNLPTEFLIEQLELHEELEFATQAHDSAKLEVLELRVIHEINKIKHSLIDLFLQNDCAKICMIIPIFSYYEKLLENINDKILNI